MKITSTLTAGLVAALLSAACSKSSIEPATGMEVGAENEPSTVTLATTTSTTVLHTQRPVSYSVSSNIGGFLEALPGNYSSTSTKHPLIIYLHSYMEMGNGSTDLGKISSQAIPKLIKDGHFPATFSVNGQVFSFIVLSPQFKTWPRATDVQDMIRFASSRYRVDPARVYICGISMGGGGTWLYGSDFSKTTAAIVTMAGAQSLKDQGAYNIATAALPVWAFHNGSDTVVNPNFTYSWISRIKKYGNPVVPRQTIFNSYAHDCWAKASYPGYKETINGISRNIYEWMLTYRRSV